MLALAAEGASILIDYVADPDATEADFTFVVYP